jgi:hypothetical protein
MKRARVRCYKVRREGFPVFTGNRYQSKVLARCKERTVRGWVRKKPST